MSVFTESHHLCVNCEKIPTCQFIKDSKRSVFVLECADFKGFTALPPRNIVGDVPFTAARFQAVAMEKEPGRYMGLCTNCADSKTCHFPKPEGGIWECDEYK